MANRGPGARVLRALRGLLFGHSRPRQTRLYCTGAPRTGTHSVAAIFDRSLRSRHEPDFRAATRAVLDHARGALSADELRRFVRRRDERLRLDVDSSHVNVFLIEALAAEFADARFVLTIRDCFSWLDSALNHARNTRKWSAADREYLDFYFGARDADYSQHDAFLRELGLPSVDSHLRAWRRHNDTALRAAPPDRLLVVRTDQISRRLPEIAAFAGVAADRIAPDFAPKGRARAAHHLLARIDAGYVDERAAEHCGALMARWFPDVRSIADVRPAAASRTPARGSPTDRPPAT